MVVLLWEPIVGSEWYEINVEPHDDAIEANKEGVTANVTNLRPGTLYRFTVTVHNHPNKGTDSLPASVEQFTSE